MPNLDQSVPLLPLRLEIRRMDGSVKLAGFSSSQNTASQANLNRHDVRDEAFPSPEYWVRWYPDELALKVPPKEISAQEEEAFNEYRKFCLRQADHVPAGLLEETEKVVADLRVGSTEDAEEVLSRYNGFIPGMVSGSHQSICAEYNRRASVIIQASLDQQKERLPEDRLSGVRLGWKVFYDFENPAIAWAFRRFVEKVGIIRARFLLSNFSIERTSENGVSSKGIEEVLAKGVRILMPEHIHLFTVEKDTGDVLPLVTGASIQSGELLLDLKGDAKSLWLLDFEEAVGKGMGVKIVDQKMVRQIENATWLIGVGVSDDRNSHLHQEFIETLQGFSSRGDLALSFQDFPTNNTEGLDSPFSEMPTDLRAYVQQIRMEAFEGVSGGDEDLSDRLIPKEGVYDVHLLAEALNAEPSLFAQVPGSHLQEQNLAQSMGLLIWRTCSEFARQEYKISESTWGILENIFIKFVHARGTLPILAIGDNPYGVLPVMKTSNWKIYSTGLDDREREVLTWINKIGVFLRREFADLAKNVPSLSKLSQESSNYTALLEILRLRSVSNELYTRKLTLNERGHVFEKDAHQIMEPLVQDHPDVLEERSPSIPGREYLEAIAYGVVKEREREGNLLVIESTASDGRKSVLVSPKELAAVKGEEPPKYSVLHKILSLYLFEKRNEIQQRLDGLKSAVIPLLAVDVKELEILMMEGVDLLSFRLDAWITALATIRMVECSKAHESQASKALGVYGWLENPGEIADAEEDSEYIQAPSLQQAATAALLRSGSQNLRPSATEEFQLHLDSEHVEMGVTYMEKLRQGYLPGEILGFRLEKMIHELAKSGSSVKDSDIYFLREIFRLPHMRTAEGPQRNTTAYSSLIDGKAFIEKFDEPSTKRKLGKLGRRKVAELKRLKGQLEKTTDSAADLAVAETVFQFMRGNSSRVSAWMDFLEGEVSPPDVEFIRSPRTGQVRQTRIYVAIDPNQVFSGGRSLLQTYDPTLNQFCIDMMPSLDEQVLRGKVQRNNRFANFEIHLSLLRVTPFSLFLDGKEQLQYRIRCLLLSEWIQGKWDEELQPFPFDGEREDLLRMLDIEVDWDQSTLDPHLIDRLQSCMSRYQNEELGININPIEDPQPSCLETYHNTPVDWVGMTRQLEERQIALREQMEGLSEELSRILESENGDSVLAFFENPFEEEGIHNQLADLGITAALITSPLSKLDHAQSDYAEMREKGIQSGLRRVRGFLEEIIRRLDSTHHSLENPSPLSPRDRAKLLIQIMRKMIGRPKAPLLLPYLFDRGSIEEINLSTSQPAGDHHDEEIILESYAKVREGVQDIQYLFENRSIFQAFSWLTKDLNEMVFSKSGMLNGKSGITLVLLEDWMEFLPSGTETTGVAIKCPTPKSQAPNAILVAVPAEIKPGGKWTPPLLAETVAEAIDLMQIRMVSSTDVVADSNLGRYFPLTYPRDETFPEERGELWNFRSRLLSSTSGEGTYEYVKKGNGREEQE